MSKAGEQDWAARKADLPVLLESANRWTDNVWTAQKYLTDKFGMEPKQVASMLHMKSDFDYVEVAIAK